MKKSELRQIIKEEIQKSFDETYVGDNLSKLLKLSSSLENAQDHIEYFIQNDVGNVEFWENYKEYLDRMVNYLNRFK